MEKPTNKAAFLEQIHSDRAKLESLLDRVPQDRLEEPGAMGDWTVKDVMAHVTAWERRLAEWLAANERPPLSGEIIEQMNQERYEQDRERPLADIQADFHRIHEAVVQRIDNFVTDESLQSTAPPPTGSRAPGWRLIAACTYLHYEEHIETLTDWLGE
jgi:uncharacterized protein (TIGR03083 family)